MAIGAADPLITQYVWDFPLAWGLGIVFQYLTIVPSGGGGRKLRGLWQATGADTMSILGFQLGLFGWMAVSHEILWSPPVPINSSTYWWMMEVGMVFGYFTAWPVNRWHIGEGWKEKMDHRRQLAPMVERVEHSHAA